MQDLLYDLYIERRVIEEYKLRLGCLEVWAKDSYGLEWAKKQILAHEESALEKIKDFLNKQIDKQITELQESRP